MYNQQEYLIRISELPIYIKGVIHMKNMVIIIYKIPMFGRPIDEIFAVIDGFSLYMASNYGEIYNTRTHTLCNKTYHRRPGRTKIRVRINVIDDNGIRKGMSVARLVLMAFDPRMSYEGLEANHKDLNTLNNCRYNLEWLTHLENIHDYYRQVNVNGFVYEDNLVHNICKGLCENLSYEEICNRVGLEYTDAVKCYISGIRTKKFRRDISDQYTLPNKVRNVAVFTDDQIHFICRCILDGMESKDILIALNMDLPIGSRERLNVLEIIRRIRAKERFQRISDLYF